MFILKCARMSFFRPHLGSFTSHDIYLTPDYHLLCVYYRIIEKIHVSLCSFFPVKCNVIPALVSRRPTLAYSYSQMWNARETKLWRLFSLIKDCVMPLFRNPCTSCSGDTGHQSSPPGRKWHKLAFFIKLLFFKNIEHSKKISVHIRSLNNPDWFKALMPKCTKMTEFGYSTLGDSVQLDSQDGQISLFMCMSLFGVLEPILW
jgi:hypothetical protein